MKSLLSLTGLILIYVVFALSSCAVEQQMATPAKPSAPAAPAMAEAKKAAPAEKAEAKVKAVKVSGDVGLLDLEKNYLILVTKEGKLITADFTGKTNVTKLIPQPAKMSDINLGQSAAVTYTTKGNKNIADSVEYAVKAKKGE